MPTIRFVFALCGLLAAVSPAWAGPIWPTFRVDSITSPNSVNGGTVHFDTPQGNQAGPWKGLPRVLTEVVFDPARPADGSTIGVTRFATNLQLEDGAGHVGVLHLNGSAQSFWNGTCDLRMAKVTFDDFTPQTIRVGDQSYTTDVFGAKSNAEGPVSGLVMIQSAQTPEPGTLALVGMGLASLVAYYLRRKG